MATTESKRPTAKHKFEGHENTVWSFVFLHDNVHIVSGSEDGTMRKWSCDTGLLVGEPWESEGGLIQTLALSSDGQTIACVRGDGSVQLWDTSGKKNGVWEGHNRGSLSWSPSGGHIANGAHDGTILIRNAKSGKVKVGPIQTNQGGVDILQYSPSGEKIASGGENETIYIWDSNTGDHLVGPIKHVGGWITSVAWSVDGGELYSASDSNFIRVFDSVSGALLRWLEHDHRVYSVALSPKNNLLACVGINGTARLWDTELHQPFGQPFGEEGQERLYCASFSQDGKYLAYGGDHNTVTLWMVEDIAPELLVDATNSFGRPGNDGITEEGHGDIYGDHFWV
ncbi:WD40 repeat-like protein [Rhizopogon vinicolor AM-OR11-026]|uniref:WD40 repeat-like protein n=1 Tax=Rhizopogon vinicolor AM-OR11-026 TaxID=1314800 RepID=A0A1B7N740_9AGAM|nr:WD40 repeat-like protein [Rhizopogon vinicolor AM-OR11-026]